MGLQGLWRKDGTPVFPNGMAIMAHNPTTPRKQRVQTPSLVIIEFVLGQLPHLGTAGQLLHLSLMQNYVVEPERLHYEVIKFELNSSDALKTHNKYVRGVVKELGKRYFILIVVVPLLTQLRTTGISTMWWWSSTPIPTTPQVTCGTVPPMFNRGSLQLRLSIMYSFHSFCRTILTLSPVF